jgi:hypothetical protein
MWVKAPPDTHLVPAVLLVGHEQGMPSKDPHRLITEARSR